ncbi:MAG: L-serine ammonia-lyase, iron-sulfur-dependent, subunit alpha [Erysipelotrichaceae bacterium]|nr:L-serine ammonia-lyase, iron-sulfur-dependent, subunit alpha [Erysipelotrichaceae bacterium]
MKAIKDIYRIGYGPSSSHTIAPQRAASFYKKQYPEANEYQVKLCGSLALTGKGHRTDEIICETLAPAKTKVTFDYEDPEMRLFIQGKNDKETYPEWTVISLGGGSIRIDQFECGDEKDVYPKDSFTAIKGRLEKENITLPQYLLKYEPDLYEALDASLDNMIDCVERGLHTEGLLNQELNYYRSAAELYKAAEDDMSCCISYAYAVGEENAAGHKITTAPTLGSAGIIASIAYYYYHDLHTDKEKVIEAMAVGGVFGDLIKQNATIAGSMGGCQAEVGTACAMGAAMIAWLEEQPLEIVERAAEIGIEHHLGLTCDPVKGYVIIPCIERNGVAVLRSFDAVRLARSLAAVHKHSLVSFDMVVDSMNYTGKKLAVELRETSLGGLALEFANEKD